MARHPNPPQRPAPPAPPQPAEPLAILRARAALTAVDGIEVLKGTQPGIGNYRNFVQSLPATILRNGLGQAMAMEKAGRAKDKGHGLLFDQMQLWLCVGWAKSPYRSKPDDLMRAIVEGDQTAYVRAQAEALAYLDWLKKYAVAALPEPPQQ